MKIPYVKRKKRKQIVKGNISTCAHCFVSVVKAVFKAKSTFLVMSRGKFQLLILIIIITTIIIIIISNLMVANYFSGINLLKFA